MTKITTELHQKLIEIADAGTLELNEKLARKLELMGFIDYEFGGKWKVSHEGLFYLKNNQPPLPGHDSPE
jgi:hypothetical protein